MEAAEFRDLYPKIKKKGVEVVGVSKDTAEAHAKFKAKLKLPYRLLADPDLEMLEAYGVWKEKNMYGKKVMGVVRSSFLIDGNGKVQKVFWKVKSSGHAAEVLAAL